MFLSFFGGWGFGFLCFFSFFFFEHQIGIPHLHQNSRMDIKGPLDKYNIIPQLFQEKSWDCIYHQKN